jgi:hypothetical protein
MRTGRQVVQISYKGLEGIVLDPTGEFFLTVKEENNEIIRLKANTQAVVDKQRLADMAGYDDVVHYLLEAGPTQDFRV